MSSKSLAFIGFCLFGSVALLASPDQAEPFAETSGICLIFGLAMVGLEKLEQL